MIEEQNALDKRLNRQYGEREKPLHYNAWEDPLNMKKMIALLLTLAMLLSLTACSISFLNREVNNPDVKPEAPAVQPEEPSVPAGDGDDIAAVEPEIPADKPDTLLPDPEKDDGEESAAPEERTVMSSHKDVTLFSAGETFRLTVWDSNGKDPDTCTYTSADPSVAAVDEGGGEVTAVAPGTTTVTAHVSYGDESQDFDCIVRCNWKEEEVPSASEGTDKPVQASVSLNDFFSTLQGSYEGLDSMMALDGELLDTYYPGLSSIDAVEEVLVQETMMTMANMAVGLVKLSDDATSDDIVAVQNALQTRINAQADGGAWYPASCETWKNGIITSTSNAVGMFVYPENAQDMADLFAETFSN